MASAADRSVASAVRPGLRHTAQPPSPHTPSRTYSSTFSSPGAGYRQDEDVVILELGSRYLRAGFEGDASPQCCVTFSPETARRVGDYRDWEPGAHAKFFKHGSIEAWSSEHELWRANVRDLDLGLFEDKFERALRDVYNKYLLTEAGSQRLILILPSLMPHPTLSSLLHLVFTRWNFASVGLLPSPTTITLAAGLRCALVVDIGWAETTVTAVYEYRETNTQRSTRAMKQTVREMAKVLYPPAKDDEITAKATDEHVNFDFAEEVIVRLGWCRTIIGEPSSEALGTEQTVQIEMPSGSQLPVLETTRRALSQPVETALFASGFSRQDLDDEELPLPQLVFRALTVLPPDVRGICMSRIIFTGGGSNIPGLSKRVLDEVATLMSSYGWNNVRGKVIDKERDRLKEISANKPVRASAGNTTPSNAERSEIDPIEEKLRRIHLKESKPPVQGILREVKSLGAWAGASLLSGMKVRGLVEVERERFLQHGLAGAHKEGEVSTVPTRQSFGPGLAKAAGDRSSWTLAGWG